MPQYELDGVGPSRATGLFRGRSPEDAVRRAAPLDEAETVEVGPAMDEHGWHDVRIGGEAQGRLRAHQRMRFRRD